nr:MAG TPA: hypothetical protein [Caudoviricetes sp.]
MIWGKSITSRPPSLLKNQNLKPLQQFNVLIC